MLKEYFGVVIKKERVVTRRLLGSKTPEDIVARVGMCDMFAEASLSRTVVNICQNICTTPDFSMHFGNDPRRVRDSSGFFPSRYRQTGELDKRTTFSRLHDGKFKNEPKYHCGKFSKQTYLCSEHTRNVNSNYLLGTTTVFCHLQDSLYYCVTVWEPNAETCLSTRLVPEKMFVENVLSF